MAATSSKKRTSTKKVTAILPIAVGRRGRLVTLIAKRVKSGKIKKTELVVMTSHDGVKFSGRPALAHLKKIHLKKSFEEDLSGCHDWRLFGHGSDLVLTYLSNAESGISYAVTKEGKNWLSVGRVEGILEPGVFVPETVTRGDNVIYFGGKQMGVATSGSLEHWKIATLPNIPTGEFFDGANFEVLAAWPLKDHIAVLYGAEEKVDIMQDVNLSDQKIGEKRFLKLGAALFAKDKPAELFHQTELPLLELPVGSDSHLQVVGVTALGKAEDLWRIYFVTGLGELDFFDLPSDLLFSQYKHFPRRLKKYEKNPILSPSGLEWEAGGTFNPTAVYLGGKVHLLYRAVGNDGYSYVGYAASSDALNIDDRLLRPAYLPREPFEGQNAGPHGHDLSVHGSGGGWGGCEDPKATLIGDRLYMTYVAHNGYWPMRTALTSISTDDFLHKRWNWSSPVIMSPPGVGSKSVVILPEKIDGQYVIFHRLWPDIVVDVVPELDFGEGKRWLRSEFKIPPRRSYWDSQKLSMGAAPIKTSRGWLAIYNAVDRHDSSRYKIGAMLLDLHDPKKVIARSRYPILSPDDWYENAGKPGIAYPGGAIDIDGLLYVYYGGADRVTCVATIPTEEMVDALLAEKEPHVKISEVQYN